MKIRNLLLIIFLLVAIGNVSACVETWFFENDGNFSLGTYENIDSSQGFLNLSSDVRVPPYLWVANSYEATISKIDTNTNKEVARYWTGGGGQSLLTLGDDGHYPSRTSVDSQGNVFVANRRLNRALLKIAGPERNCIDRNNNGIIDTSRDEDNSGVIEYDEIIPWDANTDGIPDDECILFVVNYWPGLSGSDVAGRAVSIDLNGYVWVGIWQEAKYYKIDPNDGSLLDEVTINIDKFDHHPYGSVIDGNGYLWSSGSGVESSVVRIDTNIDHTDDPATYISTDAWGSGYIPVPADYDGDGRMDRAVFNQGYWYFEFSSGIMPSFIQSLSDAGCGGNPNCRNFGAADAIPWPADRDGDGMDDLGVYRPGIDYNIFKSTGSIETISPYGFPGTLPCTADYDGDGLADMCAYEIAKGAWYFIFTKGEPDHVAYWYNSTFGYHAFGYSQTYPAPGDYDGDGMDDMALYRIDSTEWYIAGSNRGFFNFTFGDAGRVGRSADYDGYGFDDVVAYNPDQTWDIRIPQKQGVKKYPLRHHNYGIISDENNNIWLGTAGDDFTTLGKIITNSASDPIDFLTFSINNPSTYTRGLARDNQGNIWIADSNLSKVYEFSNAGNYIRSINTGTEPVGVIKDNQGYIWVINKFSDDAWKIDPSTGAHVATVDTGQRPYTYSDATGSILFQFVEIGIWNITINNPSGLTNFWNKINWTQENVKTGGRITVKIGNETSPLTEVLNNQDIGNSSSLNVEVIIKRNDDGTSPRLTSLGFCADCVTGTSEICDNNRDDDCDGDIDCEDDDCENDVYCGKYDNINFCSQCNDMFTCVGAPASIGKRTVNNIFENKQYCESESLYESTNTSALDNCYFYIRNCKCIWNGTDCLANYTRYYNCTSGSSGLTSGCTYAAVTSEDNCNTTGLITYTRKAIIPSPHCPDKSTSYQCPEQAKLGFFDDMNMILSLGLVIFIYAFFLLKIWKKRGY